MIRHFWIKLYKTNIKWINYVLLSFCTLT
jgi:hypothetical protein